MKKHLFPLVMGTIMLTACTSEVVIDVDPTQVNRIGFENVVNKNSRNAVQGDLTKSSFDNFMVYGYYTKPGMATPIQIFNSIPVTKTTNAAGQDEWTYSGVRYWVPECTYYFYAYSCADIALALDKGRPAMTLTNAQTNEARALSILGYECDGDHQHDLVTASYFPIVASAQNNPLVSLKFTHALCKIKAVFTTDFPEGYEVKVSNISISDFDNYADYNVHIQSWSNFREEDNPLVHFTIPGSDVTTNAPNSAVTTSEVFMIPKFYDQDTEYAKLYFTVKVTRNGEEIFERNITGTWSPKWEKAKVYQYNINISGSSTGIEPIVFAASQNIDESGSSWEDSKEVSMIFSPF